MESNYWPLVIDHIYYFHRPNFAHSLTSIDGGRPASCKVWDAMNDPEYKYSTATNKTPFNIAYDTTLDYFKYTKTVRPDMAERTQKAMGGKAFNLEEFLNRKQSVPLSFVQHS